MEIGGNRDTSLTNCCEISCVGEHGGVTSNQNTGCSLQYLASVVFGRLETLDGNFENLVIYFSSFRELLRH